MNEAGYIRAVRNHLPKEVYVWKIADRFSSGVPDTWYSGSGGSLFVEWKYLPTCPKKHTAKLTHLQKNWLAERYKEGRHLAVIIGTPSGGIILTDLAWETQITINQTHKPKELAKWITKQVL